MTDRQLLHAFKNQLSIVDGFCELILTNSPTDSQDRRDVLKIQGANRAALDLLAEVERRLTALAGDAAPPETPEPE